MLHYSAWIPTSIKQEHKILYSRIYLDLIYKILEVKVNTKFKATPFDLISRCINLRIG